jgi:hypothetical protein
MKAIPSAYPDLPYLFAAVEIYREIYANLQWLIYQGKFALCDSPNTKGHNEQWQWAVASARLATANIVAGLQIEKAKGGAGNFITEMDDAWWSLS